MAGTHTPQAKQAGYYQVSYGTYPSNTKVTTFSKDDLVSAKTLINKVEHTL